LFRHLKPLPPVAALAAISLFLGSCGDDPAARPAALASQPTQAATVAGVSATAPAVAIATPQMIPVTPVSLDYFIVEPKIEPIAAARLIVDRVAEGGNGTEHGYAIEVPDAWNGSVVYFAHGFRGNPAELTISEPPNRKWLVANGYAWAASSYSRNGYEPGAGARDTFALQQVFAERVGVPRRSYLYGQSMGGHVAALSLELYPEAYDGVLSECGAVSGREVLDYFTSWGALASYFTKIDLLGSVRSTGVFGVKIKDEVYPALGPLDDLTPAGEAFVDVVRRMTGGERPFFREGLDGNYEFNFVILVNAVGTAGPATAAADNRSARYEIGAGFGYTSEQINREISRIAANTEYRDAEAYPEFAALTGEIRRPHLTLHDTGDLFVPISLEQSYRRTVDAAGSGDLLVQRAVRRAGHCNFSEAERDRAFSDLVAWVERGEKPAGDDLLGDLMEVGRAFTDPPEPADPGVVR
jgi:pimeloyl-ACP methyl ester carboxylesterase